jgi:hypothetical protein
VTIIFTIALPAALLLASIILGYWMLRHPKSIRDRPGRRVLPLSLVMMAVAIRATAQVADDGETIGVIPVTLLWLGHVRGLVGL